MYGSHICLNIREHYLFAILGVKTRNKPLLLGLVILIGLSSIVLATFYPYNQKITITDSDGSYMGYVKPYQAEVLFQKYTYLKWKREGFPEGNSFPIALRAGTTTALPFGIQGELLRVKIN